MPDTLIPVVVDLIAIAAITTLYFRRHQRRDLMLAYVALNIGVLAVAGVLSAAPVGAGLGLGLFGILSIIRLRSDAITQEEVAYYFVSLAMGLVAGLRPDPVWITPVVAAGFVVMLFLVDHPWLFARRRRQLVTLDAAIPDEWELRARLETQLGVTIKHLIVNEIDFVRDMTIVDVRFVAGARRRVQAPVPVPGITGGHSPFDFDQANRPVGAASWR